jgi:hypothetical protein
VWPIRFQPQPDCPTAPTPLPCPRLRCTLTELRLSSLHVRRRLILCLHAPAPLSSCPSQQGAGHCPCLDLDGQRQLHLLVPRAGASSPTTYSTASAASTSRVRCLPGCSPHSASSPCARSHRLESTIEAHAATSSSRFTNTTSPTLLHLQSRSERVVLIHHALQYCGLFGETRRLSVLYAQRYQVRSATVCAPCAVWPAAPQCGYRSVRRGRRYCFNAFRKRQRMSRRHRSRPPPATAATPARVSSQ